MYYCINCVKTLSKQLIRNSKIHKNLSDSKLQIEKKMVKLESVLDIELVHSNVTLVHSYSFFMRHIDDGNHFKITQIIIPKWKFHQLSNFYNIK